MRVAGYDVEQAIGRGGYGVVYRGRDAKFARDVAIKLLNNALEQSTAARFERECHAVGALSGHPHIVVVHDSGTSEDGSSFLVMELLPGGSLAERISKRGPQSWQSAADLGVQLAGALETAHRAGVLHRDVKPENILFSAYGHPKLVDFGIASVRDGYQSSSSGISASLAHAAPEIVAGQRSSPASDVYALGSTLFQLLTGRPAFVVDGDETLFPLLARIATDPVPDLRPYAVPDAVATVIERAMAKAPADRFVSALAFGHALREASTRNGHAPAPPVVLGDVVDLAAASAPPTQPRVTPLEVEKMPFVPAPQPPRPRSRLLPTLVAAAVLLAGAVLYTQRDRTPVSTASYLFASSGDGVVRASRTWRLDGSGTTLQNETTLINRSQRSAVRTALEVIPKSVANDVGQVHFSGSVVVVERDPVVRWTARLAPGQQARLRWTVRLRSKTTVTELEQRADDQRAAESALQPRLPAIMRSAHLPMTQLLPFTAATDPGLGATPTPTAGPTLTATPTSTPGATAEPHRPGKASSAPPSTPTANQAPVLAPVGNVGTDELAPVTVSLVASDPDGDSVVLGLQGALPAGLSFDGRRITGSVKVGAVSLTQTRTSLKPKPFVVTATVRDSRGRAGTSRRFTITVRDTHIVMPNYVGHYGCRGAPYACGDPSWLPGFNQLAAPDFLCEENDSKPSGSVAWQSVAAGRTFRWGAGLVVRTYAGTGKCPA